MFLKKHINGTVSIRGLKRNDITVLCDALEHHVYYLDTCIASFASYEYFVKSFREDREITAKIIHGLKSFKSHELR